MNNTFYLVGARGSLKHELINRINVLHSESYGELSIKIEPVDPTWLANLSYQNDNHSGNIPNNDNNIIYIYTTAYDQEQILTANGHNFAEALRVTNEDLYHLRKLPQGVFILAYRPNDDFIDNAVEKIHRRIMEVVQD